MSALSEAQKRANVGEILCVPMNSGAYLLHIWSIMSIKINVSKDVSRSLSLRDICFCLCSTRSATIECDAFLAALWELRKNVAYVSL